MNTAGNSNMCKGHCASGIPLASAVTKISASGSFSFSSFAAAQISSVSPRTTKEAIDISSFIFITGNSRLTPATSIE